MTFGDYMNSLSTEKVSEKESRIQQIMEACMVKRTVVYNWIARRSVPDALKRKTISGLLGRPADELFPSANQ